MRQFIVIFVLFFILFGALFFGALETGLAPLSLSSRGTAALLTATPADTGGAGAAARDELFALLDSLTMLTLDETLFVDSRFQSLIDWSVPIAPQPTGRKNPFLPIGVGE